MYNLNTRGSRGKRRRGPRGLMRRDLGWLVALGAAVPVLVTGHVLVSPGDGRAAPVTDVLAGATSSPVPVVGGWGEGGYPMVAGFTAGDAAPGEGPGEGTAANAAGVTNVASANWAGYAATGAAGSFTSVSSSWAQPTVSCGAASTFSSFWVGLDGDGTPTVEQTGTEADCANGTATYQGWYETFPNAPVFFANRVQPGDAMSASVVADGAGTFTLTLSDATQGWTQITQQAEAAAQLGSAEVIAEAPSDGTVLPLADFGTVNFTAATVNHAPIGASANLSELTLQSAEANAQATALATPSALTGGNAFSVTADNIGATPATEVDPAGVGTAGGGGGASDGGGRRHHHHDFGF
jgi:Peptidase A4 family